VVVRRQVGETQVGGGLPIGPDGTAVALHLDLGEDNAKFHGASVAQAAATAQRCRRVWRTSAAGLAPAVWFGAFWATSG
jgi:hypothetical protein